jgi:hypothetical protein
MELSRIGIILVHKKKDVGGCCNVHLDWEWSYRWHSSGRGTIICGNISTLNEEVKPFPEWNPEYDITSSL